MKKDPKVRKDGMCAQCRKPRTPKKGLSGQTGTFARLFAAEVERDPFCSAVCAKTWHGVSLKISPGTSRIPPERIKKWEGAEYAKTRRQRLAENGFAPNHVRGVSNYKMGCRCDGCTAAGVAWRKKRTEMEKAAAA